MWTIIVKMTVAATLEEEWRERRAPLCQAIPRAKTLCNGGSNVYTGIPLWRMQEGGEGQGIVVSLGGCDEAESNPRWSS